MYIYTRTCIRYYVSHLPTAQGGAINVPGAQVVFGAVDEESTVTLGIPPENSQIPWKAEFQTYFSFQSLIFGYHQPLQNT